jgi:hypothetical protein
MAELKNSQPGDNAKQEPGAGQPQSGLDHGAPWPGETNVSKSEEVNYDPLDAFLGRTGRIIMEPQPTDDREVPLPDRKSDYYVPPSGPVPFVPEEIRKLLDTDPGLYVRPEADRPAPKSEDS